MDESSVRDVLALPFLWSKVASVVSKKTIQTKMKTKTTKRKKKKKKKKKKKRREVSAWEIACVVI